MEEVEIINDTVKPTQLYVKYNTCYDGKEVEIISSEITTVLGKDICKLCDRNYGSMVGNYSCLIYLKYEEANEEIAKDRVAALIARHKILHNLTPVDIQLINYAKLAQKLN